MIKKVRKAVIPVAGDGSRFLPGTKATPKEMFPIIDTPTIQLIVEECVASGIEEILFITSPHKKIILDHFDKSYELEKRFEERGKTEELEIIRNVSKLAKVYAIRQGEPYGTGHAFGLAKSFVGDEYFAALYGDDLWSTESDIPVLKQLINVHEKTGGSVIGGLSVPDNMVSKYGIVKYKDKETGEMEAIVEKPKFGEHPSNDAGLGRYIVSPKIFNVIENIAPNAKGEIDFTDSMKELMKTEPFYFRKLDGKYHDIGNKLEFVKTVIHFALKREEMKEPLLEYMKEKIENN